MSGIFLLIFILYNVNPYQGAISLFEPEISSDELDFMLPDLNGNIVSSDDEIFLNKVIFITTDLHLTVGASFKIATFKISLCFISGCGF